MSSRTLKIEQADLGDIVLWKWSGVHAYDDESIEKARAATEQFLSDMSPAKPVLLDISGMQYGYADGLVDVLECGLRLQRCGYRIAVLLSRRNSRMMGQFRAMKIDPVMKTFVRRGQALRSLRTGEISEDERN